MSASTQGSPHGAELRFSAEIEGAAVAGWRWPRAGAPRLLFCHANGFCASAYKSMLRTLATAADIYAIDLRGHGRTRLPADPAGLKSWDGFAGDVAAFLDAKAGGGERGWILAGHSMGAVAATLAARGRGDVRNIVLIEPVAPPPLTAMLANTPAWRMVSARSGLVKGALARRAEWPDRRSALESYARKPIFQKWRTGVLEDYLEDGLADGPGGVRLACAPEWEAACFSSYSRGFWRAVAETPAPVSILGGARGSTVFPGSARRFSSSGATVRRLAGAGHLLPMEAPDDAAGFITAAAGLKP